MRPKHQPLYPGNYYHIYNRGNNRENLFYKPENYFYFLRRYGYYLNNYLETYAYCLLPNHFHLLVKIKQKDELLNLPGFQNLEGLSSDISRKFSNFFNGYSKAINKQQNRVGSLFPKNFKRIRVDNYKYLITLLYYIHANPQLHGLIEDFKDWPYSSYNRYLELNKSHLPKNEVLSWFGSLKEYEIYHSRVQNIKEINQYNLD